MTAESSPAVVLLAAGCAGAVPLALIGLVVGAPVLIAAAALFLVLWSSVTLVLGLVDR